MPEEVRPLDEARRILLDSAEAGVSRSTLWARALAYEAVIRVECGMESAAEVSRMREALERIANLDTVELRTHGRSAGDTCIIIARAALASLQHQEEH